MPQRFDFQNLLTPSMLKRMRTAALTYGPKAVKCKRNAKQVD